MSSLFARLFSAFPSARVISAWRLLKTHTGRSVRSMAARLTVIRSTSRLCTLNARRRRHRRVLVAAVTLATAVRGHAPAPAPAHPRLVTMTTTVTGVTGVATAAGAVAAAAAAAATAVTVTVAGGSSNSSNVVAVALAAAITTGVAIRTVVVSAAVVVGGLTLIHIALLATTTIKVRARATPVQTGERWKSCNSRSKKSMTRTGDRRDNDTPKSDALSCI